MAEIGNLDRRITFQSATDTPDVSGQKVSVWANLVSVPTVWASIEYLSGRGQSSEDYEADQLTATNKVIFGVRYRSDITAKMRIVYDSNNYDITHISEVSRKRYLKIVAEKKD